MEIIQTRQQQLQTHLPDKLDFYRIANQRGLLKSTKAQRDYKLFLAGVEGENLVLEYLEEFGHPKWKVVQNMWMNYNGLIERDIILFTKLKVYIFEVKNYSRRFSYEKGASHIGDVEIDYNCVEQTRKAAVKIKHLIKSFSRKIEVEHAILFTNPDCHVAMDGCDPAGDSNCAALSFARIY